MALSGADIRILRSLGWSRSKGDFKNPKGSKHTREEAEVYLRSIQEIPNPQDLCEEAEKILRPFLETLVTSLGGKPEGIHIEVRVYQGLWDMSHRGTRYGGLEFYWSYEDPRWLPISYWVHETFGGKAGDYGLDYKDPRVMVESYILYVKKHIETVQGWARNEALEAQLKEERAKTLLSALSSLDTEKQPA